MSVSRAVTLLAFACIGVSVAMIGRRPGSDVPTLPQLLDLAMRSPAGRASALVSWVWVGWHFFGR